VDNITLEDNTQKMVLKMFRCFHTVTEFIVSTIVLFYWNLASVVDLIFTILYYYQFKKQLLCDVFKEWVTMDYSICFYPLNLTPILWYCMFPIVSILFIGQYCVCVWERERDIPVYAVFKAIKVSCRWNFTFHNLKGIF